MFELVGCIVVYNTAFDEIEKLIREFYKEDIGQQLVIVDNSNTGYLKEKIISINKKIDYIISENVGYGHGNNIAIKKYAGKSKYFLVLNPDIVINFEDLKKLIDYAEKKKQFGIIMPKIIYPDGQIQYLCKLLPKPLNLFGRRFLFKFSFFKKIDDIYELRFTEYNKEMLVPVLSGCFMFCHYDNLLKENGFDERFFMYLEDVDLSRRMYKYKNFYYPDISVIHMHNKESYKTLKMTLIHIKSAIKYFNKWYWFFDKERKEINDSIIDKYYGR
jgi:GT2 family glycosyltransferase